MTLHSVTFTKNPSLVSVGPEMERSNLNKRKMVARVLSISIQAKLLRVKNYSMSVQECKLDLLSPDASPWPRRKRNKIFRQVGCVRS